jgi:hypothetical protein
MKELSLKHEESGIIKSELSLCFATIFVASCPLPQPLMNAVGIEQIFQQD